MRGATPVRQAKRQGCCLQTLVARPQRGASAQRGGGKQVHIDVTDAIAMQCMAANKAQDLTVSHHHCRWLALQQRQHRVAVHQVAAGEFAHHECMHQHLGLQQQAAE